jgi:ketohexokinase
LFDYVVAKLLQLFRQQGRVPETTLECITHLRKSAPEARISVEVEKPGRQGLQELAAEADVVFYSKSWAEVCCCCSGTGEKIVTDD